MQSRSSGNRRGPLPRALTAVGVAFAIAVSGCGASSTPVPATIAPVSAAPTAVQTSAPATAPASPTPAPSPSSSLAPLKDLAGSRYFGSAVAPQHLAGDDVYARLAGEQFNQVTPENEMKWGVVEPSRGQFDWSGADAIVAFAEAHGQKVRGHTLLWHNQLPDWLSNGNFNKAQLSQILQQHIGTEMGRYKGKIYAWDVVNEVIADDATMRDTIWLQTLGQGYIADAFRWARAADPGAKLYINDYDVDGKNAKSDALYDLVKSLVAQGVPIDGVGFQAHFDLDNPFPTDMAANMQRFADLGLDVAITELDARMKVPATPQSLADEATYYKGAVAACVAVARCVGITVWGFTDKYSWVPFSFPGKGAADLYDEKYAPKPALAAVAEALSSK